MTKSSEFPIMTELNHRRPTSFLQAWSLNCFIKKGWNNSKLTCCALTPKLPGVPWRTEWSRPCYFYHASCKHRSCSPSTALFTRSANFTRMQTFLYLMTSSGKDCLIPASCPLCPGPKQTNSNCLFFCIWWPIPADRTDQEAGLEGTGSQAEVFQDEGGDGLWETLQLWSVRRAEVL